MMFIELPHEIVELKFSCILRGYWCINQPIDLDKLRGGIRNPFAFFSDTMGIQSVDTDATVCIAVRLDEPWQGNA